MPGYIHTCEHCGAHMQVHERYLGRTLRCTSCRAEFLAMLPADAVVEEAAPPEVELPGPQRSRLRHLKWLVLVVPLVLLVWWLGQDETGRLLASQRSWGEIGVLENDGDGPVVVALDADSAMALIKAGGEDVRSLIERGLAFDAPRGTRVRVLESSGGGRVVRVRIISGQWESRKVWVPTRWIR
jgi:hypothetical protein